MTMNREYNKFLKKMSKFTNKEVSKSDRSVKERIATVISLETGTITVTFQNETLEVVGVVLPDSFTVVAGDKVLLTNSSNSKQSSAWRVTRVY